MDRGRPPSTPPSGPPATSSPTRRSPAPPELATLRQLLREHTLFQAVRPDGLDRLVAAVVLDDVATGSVVLDAFAAAGDEVFLVLAGEVDIWSDRDRLHERADQRLGPGRLFGFSAMLTERSLGPRAVAVGPATVAAIPETLVAPVFASPQGARFLAEQAAVWRPPAEPGGYSLVDDLLVTVPLVVHPDDDVAGVARAMGERGMPYAAVARDDGRFGLVTDAMLRQRVIVEGLPGSAPAAEVMDPDVPVVLLGDSAAEAQILMLDSGAQFLLVADRNGQLRGVVCPQDFAVSPGALGVSLHERIRRVRSVEELVRRTRELPDLLGDLLGRGLASGKVIAVHSAIVDTVVRRALVLSFEQHPELSLDAFTWLSLGSNGRREAVLSSDVDSAVTLDDDLDAAGIDRYRAVFVEVDAVLARCGLVGDDHGATAQHPAFSRTGAAWRAAALEWMAAPAVDQGAIMASLLVDGRPIHGDPGLPAAARVFADLRSHPGTQRLLLQESLSHRARRRSVRGLFSWPDEFDLKAQALLPIVNIARWAALGVGSAALSTVERLRAAGGSTMLPDEQATILIDVFEVLQRTRLRYQIGQHRRGEPPSDVLTKEQLTPIDRSMIAQAVREVAAVQRRMEHVSAYVPPREWMAPAPPS